MTIEKKVILISLYFAILSVFLSSPVVLVSSFGISKNNTSITPVWTFTTEDTVNTPPTICNANGNNELEMIFGSLDRNIYCIANDGTKIWNFTTEASIPMEGIDAIPVVIDTNQDDILEVFVGGTDGNVYCLSANDGNLIWKYDTEGIISADVAVVDTQSGFIVIAPSETGLYCLNTSNGSLRWHIDYEEPIYSSPVVADLNGDSEDEIIFGTNMNKVHCVDLISGNERWNTALPDSGSAIWTTPTILDIDGDGTLEVYITTLQGYVYRLEGDTGEATLMKTISTGWPSPIIVNINGDASEDVIVVGYRGDVVCFDASDGKDIWTYDLGADIIGTPCIADVDLDGKLEILFSIMDYESYLVCLNSEGKKEWTIEIESTDISSAAIADIDNDSNQEILIGSGEGLHCFECERENNRAIYWPWYGERGGAGATGDLADSDHDNLPDSYELFACTNPYTADGDLDGLTDSQEFAVSTDPFSNDTDQDLLPDSWEVQWELNPIWPGDANLDAELDGLTNLEEYQYGTNPRKMDSDSDTIKDIEEIQEYGTSPISNDTDSDLLSDPDELFVYGTNPLSADTDGDGYSDFEEIQAGCDPLVPDWLCHNKVPAGTAIAIGVTGVVSIILFRFRNKIKNR